MTNIEEPRERVGDVEGAHTDGAHDHAVLREVSKAMVQIYKEQFGRGPETVWSRYAGPDAILTVLGKSLTPVERTMLAMGHEERLRDIRMTFQHTAEQQFRDAVEKATGRRVIGFMSGMDVHNDLASEVFTLEPQTLST
jgi:uncharacterized protein YbcI